MAHCACVIVGAIRQITSNHTLACRITKCSILTFGMFGNGFACLSICMRYRTADRRCSVVDYRWTISTSVTEASSVNISDNVVSYLIACVLVILELQGSITPFLICCSDFKSSGQKANKLYLVARIISKISKLILPHGFGPFMKINQRRRYCHIANHYKGEFTTSGIVMGNCQPWRYRAHVYDFVMSARARERPVTALSDWLQVFPISGDGLSSNRTVS